MKNTHFRVSLCLLLVSGLYGLPALGANRYIVKTNGGLPVVQQACAALGCTVASTLDGSLGQTFLITNSGATPVATFLNALLARAGVVAAEQDVLASIASSGYTVPPALYDSAPVTYFGNTVPHGYVNQPAAKIIGLSNTQKHFGIKGTGIVAVIDTGIDSSHPVLRNVLVPGYDFTRNQNGEGDETTDVPFPTQPYANPKQSSWTNSNSTALVDQSTAAVVDGNAQYTDFGHGTMVAGVIHLVAPGAMLMPLKAFRSDGTGYTSDIIRATYWAVQNQANIINMSFNLPGYSLLMKNAVDYAALNGVICVAAAGNQGKDTLVYPAGYSNVISVASTTNADQRSSFSNYGQGHVWLAAPGEGIITTFPFSTYAAAWGTSFSTPFVSGVAALMLDYGGSLLRDILVSKNQSDSAQSVAHAKAVDSALGHGRLDTYQAITAWRQLMGK